MPKVDRLKATLSLEEGVGSLRGVSNARAVALSKLGIHNVRDLLTHYPRRYIDLTRMRTVASAQIGERCTIAGDVVGVRLKRPRPNLPIVEVSVNDGTATMIASFFRQPWIKDKVHEGQRIVVAGKTEFNYGFLRMANPFIEVQDAEGAGMLVGRVVPVHPATAKVSPAQMRSLMKTACDGARGAFDPIPLSLRIRRDLMARGKAIYSVHFPASMDEVAQAKRRLVYEELLLMQLFLMRASRNRSNDADATSHVVDGPACRALRATLPFSLTDEQDRSVRDLLGSMALSRATSRMLLGDVGTGKTIVAAFGLAAAADSGGQAMLMAPTEVLAQQHYRNLAPLLERAGASCALLTGSTPKDERQDVLDGLRNLDVQVLIGTHALLEDDVVPAKLTFVAIDEQQRFGVGQRSCLLAKGAAPDALYLTATPIPRTLALALFGGLELSYIRKRPMEGASRVTRVVRKSARGHAYDAAKAALARGEQVYVVCPLIGVGSEERAQRAANRLGFSSGDVDDERYVPPVVIDADADYLAGDAASAVKEARFLQEKVFVDNRVELLHGGMRSDKKQAVMQAFYDGDVDVLVSTTVIEVGIDVAKATVMIIEDADRFGLSQLHQLRGRVGRGSLDSEVYLVSASESEDALARLRKLEDSDDGFEVSEFDLSLRHEGDLLGYRQSGASILKLVDISRDGELVEQAHDDAAALLDADPDLEDASNAALARELRLVFGDRSPDEVELG